MSTKHSSKSAIDKIERSKEVTQLLQKFIDTKGDRLHYLRVRWQDERGYEDFAGYVAEMKKLIPSEFKFEGATKSPFGFKMGCGDYSFQISATMTAVNVRTL